MEKELSDGELRNWLKACLALKYFKEGMLPFLTEECEDLYIQNVSNVKASCNTKVYSCTGCVIDRIKPSHAKTNKCDKRKCNCKSKTTVICHENGSCSELYDLLKKLHTHNDPNFSNTNCSLWSDRKRGPWEQMKCFITTNGYTDTSHASDADVTSLIQIFENNKTLQNVLGNFSAEFVQIRKDRNAIYHSGNMKISDADLREYITHVKKVLALHVFNKYPSTTDMMSKLTELETNAIKITTQTEIEIRETVLKALKESERELKMQTEQGRNIEDELRRLWMAEHVHTEKLERIFRGLLEHINTLGKEINRTTQQLVEHNFVIRDFISDFHKDLSATIGNMVEWQREHGALLTENNKGIKKILRRLERLPHEIKRKNADPEYHDVIRAVIKVLFTTENGNVSETIVKIAKGCTQDVDPQLVAHVTSVLSQLQINGNKIVDVKNECVAIYISIPSLANWIQLCRDFLDGSLSRSLKPLQNHLRKLPKCATLELSISISEQDFIKSANSLIDCIIPLTSIDNAKTDCEAIHSASPTSHTTLLEPVSDTATSAGSATTTVKHVSDFAKYDTRKIHQDRCVTIIDPLSISLSRTRFKRFPDDVDNEEIPSELPTRSTQKTEPKSNKVWIHRKPTHKDKKHNKKPDDDDHQEIYHEPRFRVDDQQPLWRGEVGPDARPVNPEPYRLKSSTDNFDYHEMYTRRRSRSFVSLPLIDHEISSAAQLTNQQRLKLRPASMSYINKSFVRETNMQPFRRETRLPVEMTSNIDPVVRKPPSSSDSGFSEIDLF